MKKILLLSILILLLGACSIVTDGGKKEKEYTFSNTYWGMDKEEVIKTIEGLDLIEEEDSLNDKLVDLNDSDYLFYKGLYIYDTDVEEKFENVIVYFNFKKDKLVSAGYKFDSNYNFLLFPDSVPDLLEGIEKNLVAEYGEDYKLDDSFSDWGVMSLIWETDKTKIKLESNTAKQSVTISYSNNSK